MRQAHHSESLFAPRESYASGDSSRNRVKFGVVFPMFQQQFAAINFRGPQTGYCSARRSAGGHIG